MKFIKGVLFDLYYGIGKNIVLITCPIIISIIIFLDFTLRVREIKSYMDIETESFGNLWIYLYGGMKEYVPGPGNPFVFPIVWIMVLLTISFLVLNYPFKELPDIGQQILVRSQGRTRWWLSKCWWNMCATFLYHCIIMVTIILLCSVHKIMVSRQFDIDLIGALFGFVPKQGAGMTGDIPLLVFVLPPLVSMSINMMQMTCSLFIRPIFSFIAVAALFIASSYLFTPYAIGNYAMLIRGKWILADGFAHQMGVAFACMCIGASIVIGLLRFRSYDILNQE